ncbi:class I SAM-dependent methyltransferase [Leptolyngbya sp. NK1-12]|uniref:Class I SAM-dependent methyltransferase n=1 Tax=Leptolyngbya sp. NK1-12 TaxID=2547451 RepID=A0AA96WMP2_9CYAN|nr:class I SAM-dependent methyltransferase [Leptolyngbya sp. NK1-12]WNZ27575.1 class I SAM-dependent methyltransferase [Leptolyngbya sp. NK1-12]
MSFTFSSTKQASSRSIQRMLLAGIGALSFTGIACTQQRSLEQPQAVSPQAGTTEQTSPDATIQSPGRRPDVVYVPTPMPVVDEMLNLANVQSDDVVYDLGSGDGRIVIAAAQERGARGIGVEIDPQRIQEANQNAQQAGVTDRVEFLQQDLFETDFSDATVVTLYLLPELNVKLRPKLLRELRPGTRIVSHAFDMGEWEPDQVVEVNGRTVYYWVVPENPPANLL